jgi:hypothetical protein
MTNEQVIALLDRMDRESKVLKEDLLKMCWFMRGGLTYDDAMMLSFRDREMIARVIDKNLETAKKTGLPFF